MTLADVATFTEGSVAEPSPRQLNRRLLHGGLPPFYLADSLPGREFQEWMDAYWAKDILELFRLERRHSFQRFAELLMAQSGGIFEATKFATPCEVSRTTIANYLAVLEATFVAHIVRPFSRNRSDEITPAPRVYAFDTGFVCAHRGWTGLRPEDFGILWEHLVLNELNAGLQTREISYWRSKHGNEIDFVLSPKGRLPIAIECKRSANEFEPAHLRVFRARYPGDMNFVVAADVGRSYERAFQDLRVRFVDLDQLIREVQQPAASS
jgi:predicted AAA+ superfamily ATPase